MKRILLLMVFLAVLLNVKAQGTWKAGGTEAAINAATEIDLKIPGIKCMHSDVATVTGKSDTGAETVTYAGVTYDNLAYLQGSTNGMFFAFLPSSSGRLDIAVKMGSAKKTFILEVTDALWTNMSTTAGDLAKLTTTYGTADGITGNTTYFATPSVYDTFNKTNGTWNGLTSIQSTGGNVYMIMSFPVTAGKTYVVGCFGSKLMLRAATFALTTNTSAVPANQTDFRLFPNPASGKVSLNVDHPVQVGFYTMTGTLIKSRLVQSSSDQIEINDLPKGMYLVRPLKSKEFNLKLTVR